MANPNVSANVLAQLKEHVRDGITEMWFEGVNDAFLAQLETKEIEEGYGRGHVVRIVDGESSAIAGNVDDAQLIAEDGLAGSGEEAARFVVDPIEVEGFAVFTRGEYLAAKGKGADEEFELLDQKTRSCIQGMRKRWGIFAAGNGTGVLALVTGGISSATFEVDRAYANRFKVGDRIFAADADTAGTTREPGTYRRIIAVDPDVSATRCAITTSAAIAGLAVNDRIFFQGMRGAGVPAGAFSWIPGTAPLVGDSFFAQNRYGRPQLQGFRFNASTYDTAGAGIAAASRMFDFDKAPDTWYINSKSWELMTADKNAHKIVETTVGKMNIGFSKIVLNGASKRPIDVIPTMFMPPGQGLLGQFKGDKDKLPYIACVDGLANIDDIDGNTIRATKGGGVAKYYMRFFSRGNIVFPAPGEFMNTYNLPVS